MTTPKAIFFDLDGTLLIGGRVPKKAVEALVYARDKGILLFIATGRHRIEIERIATLPDLNFDGFVSLNGGYCYVNNNVIFKNAIDKEAVRIVVDSIKQTPKSCMFCEADGMFINVIDEKAEVMHEALDLAIPPIEDPVRALKNDIYQMVTFGIDLNFLNALPNCAVTSWADGCHDIVPASTNKWVGISHMIEHFGLKPSEVAAIGDGMNDIEMLQGAGYSVAMGNALDEVKKYANFVTNHVEEDGIYHAIKHLLG